MSWTLTIPDVPPSGNVQKRMHFRDYGRLLERWFLLVRCSPGFLAVPKAAGRRRVTITRIGARALDRDNLWAAVKPVVDVLKAPRHEKGVYRTGKRIGQAWTRSRIGHGLIVEDDAAHLELEVLQRIAGKGEDVRTVIEIMDRPP